MTFSYEDFEVGSAVQLGAHTFSREEIVTMMQGCGLRDIRISEGPPFWVALGRKR